MMRRIVVVALLLPFSYSVDTTGSCDDSKPPPTPRPWTGNWGSQLSDGLSKVRESTENIASKAVDTGAAYASKAVDTGASYNEVLQHTITEWKNTPNPDLSEKFILHLKSKGYLVEENNANNSTYFLNGKSKSIAIPLWLPDSSGKNHVYCAMVSIAPDQSSLDENGKAEMVSIVYFFFSETPDKPIVDRQVPLATKIPIPGLSISLPRLEDYGSGGLFLEVNPKIDAVTQKMIYTITIEAGYKIGLSGIVEKYFAAQLYSFDTNFGGICEQPTQQG